MSFIVGGFGSKFLVACFSDAVIAVGLVAFETVFNGDTLTAALRLLNSLRSKTASPTRDDAVGTTIAGMRTE